VGKRLGIGLLKGLVLGAAIAAGVSYGAHWATPSGGLLAYLLALGVGGTAGIFGGRAPWKEGAWIEAAIKGLVGVCVAALLYWLASAYAARSIPWPGASSPIPWTSIPLLFLPAIGAIFGALVELDHDDADGKPAKKKSAASKARVAPSLEIEDADVEAAPAGATRPARKKT